ncbi:peptidase M23 [Thermotomaculum hydrothermale]|uniref:Peptidase M23 n=1 Tax=Thermotomaculum hydrothermale TaxID=981385 RepID=A0A7R6PFC6_9BACT|nr:M23 family metallopeptidase [Thermotomaculum hydrothermale]BBB32704.1 peptidase M23 [Thermotomaculum hydrothermale]
MDKLIDFVFKNKYRVVFYLFLFFYLTLGILFFASLKFDFFRCTPKNDKNLLKAITNNQADLWYFGEILPYKGFEDSIMAVDGVKLYQALKIVNSLRNYVDFRFLKAGEKFRFKLSKDGKVVERFIYCPNPVIFHILEWDYKSGKYIYSKKVLPTKIRYKLIEGELKTTLNDALKETGVSDNVRNTVNNVIECFVPIRTSARRGDKFKVLLEERVFDGRVVLPEKVLYACYNGKKTGRKEAFYYREADEKSSYNGHYSADGKALIASAFRYPLRRIHVTSTFGWRRHPVTGKRSFHNGVDYRARVGEPVFAVYNGVVIQTGYSKYNGKFIVIKHPGNIKTYYLHLSRILVRKGLNVKAGQIIGRTGATGRVNGPHLHFGIRDARGKWVNPLLKRMIATPKLKGKRLKEFKKQVEEIRKILKSIEKEKLKG